MMRSKILVALNRQAEASVAERKALDLGTSTEVDQFARDLMAKKKAAEALTIFRQNATRHPGDWFVHDGLARAYSAQGQFADAAKEMRVAVTNAPPSQKNHLESLLTKLDAKQDISASQ